MDKWEYTFHFAKGEYISTLPLRLRHRFPHNDAMLAVLNEYGQQGWEMTGVHETDGGAYFYFKRKADA